MAAFEQFKKKTNPQISNYGGSAQASFVACLCAFVGIWPEQK